MYLISTIITQATNWCQVEDCLILISRGNEQGKKTDGWLISVLPS